VYATEAYQKVQLQALLTSALDGSEWSAVRPGRLNLQKAS